MTVDELLNKLQRPQWFKQDIYKIMRNPYGNEAAMNIAWLLNGKPKKITQDFFTHNWTAAVHMVEVEVEGYKLKEWVTLLSLPEFGELVQRNPEVFAKYLPLAQWKKLTSKSRNVAMR